MAQGKARTSPISKAEIGLSNVDNTSDINKPVSTAQDIAIDAKVADNITDGVTTIAPSQNAVFDALAGKQATGNYFDKTSDDTDDITVGATNKFATTSEKTKLGFIAVTQAVDLDTIETNSNASKVVTDFITVTQAVDLDTLESDTATNNAKITNATHTGDATGATALTVVRINGQSLASLATGLLKNTTGTGVPSIAVNSDLPPMTSTVGGAVPTPPNNTTTFLRGDGTFASPTSGATITTQDEGTPLSTTVTTLNFTGAGVTASGAGATTTINIAGGGGGLNEITATATWTFGSEEDTIVNTIINVSLTTALFKGFTIIPVETTATSLDDFKLNSVTFNVENIINNTSFDIRATAANNATGVYTATYKIIYS